MFSRSPPDSPFYIDNMAYPPLVVCGGVTAIKHECPGPLSVVKHEKENMRKSIIASRRLCHQNSEHNVIDISNILLCSCKLAFRTRKQEKVCLRRAFLVEWKVGCRRKDRILHISFFLLPFLLPLLLRLLLLSCFWSLTAFLRGPLFIC